MWSSDILGFLLSEITCEKVRGNWWSHGGPSQLGAGCYLWVAHSEGSRAPWDASRRLPKEMSHCSFLQGHLRNQRLPATLVLEEEKGHYSQHSSLPSGPFSFCPPSHFLHVSKLSVMRPTYLQENAVHLPKSLLETILKQKWISARYTSLEKASVCLKTGVLDLACMMMWLKRIQYTLVLWLTQNLPLPACSTEENTLIEQNMSVSWFFLSLIYLHLDRLLSLYCQLLLRLSNDCPFWCAGLWGQLPQAPSVPKWLVCWLRARIQITPPAFSALNPRSGSCKGLELEEWLSSDEAEVGKAVSLWPRCSVNSCSSCSFVSPFTLDSQYLLHLFYVWMIGFMVCVGRVILPYKFPVGVQLSCF